MSLSCVLHPIKCAEGAAGSVAGDALTTIAKDAANGITDVIKLIATSWLSIPSPFTSGSGTAVTAASDPTSTWLQTQLEWALGVSMILGLIAALTFTIVKASRGKAVADDVGGIFDSVLRVMAVIVFGDLLVGLLLAVGSDFSSWILHQAGTSYSSLGASLNLDSLAVSDPFLMLLLGVVVLVGALVQVVVVAGIAAVLPILVGLWPMSAAWSSTEAGNQTWKKHSAWILAAILYKPAAAIIYAVAFKMFTGGVACPAGATCDAQTNSQLSQILGCMLLLLAVLALPALLRLVVPAVSAIGGISAGEALGAGAALATGAVMIAATGGISAAAGGAGAAGAASDGATGPATGAVDAPGGTGPASDNGPPGGEVPGSGGDGGDPGGGGGRGSSGPLASGSGGDDDDSGGADPHDASSDANGGASGAGDSGSSTDSGGNRGGSATGGQREGTAGTSSWHAAHGVGKVVDVAEGAVPDEEAE
jgi:type IV secretion system protein TrbL